MDLQAMLDGIEVDVATMASLGDEQTAELGARMAAGIGPSLRLRLYDLLSQAALEISDGLPSGHVEVRLAGQEPSLVYVDDAAPADAGDGGEDLSARITLRLPDALKAAIERAANRDGLSTNAWLVRALRRAVELQSRPSTSTRTGRRISGYAQS
jgi:hypothetical protein